MADLFSPLTVGAVALNNRLIMAPLTRGRAQADGTPTAIMADYYAQRATAGLIITEATGISRQGLGWYHAPGIWADTHVAVWQPVVAAVHKLGGKIFMQLWHMGRASHPDFLDGALPVAPSAIAIQGETHTPQGKKPYVTPRALETHELPGIVQDYAHAAQQAKRAGFDGVEIHGANGYLLDEFLRNGANKRTDAYGGSIENRLRLLLEVVEAVVAVWGQGRVGLRISPVGGFNDMSDSDPVALYSALAQKLNSFPLAYLHVLEGLPGSMLAANHPAVHPHIRALYKGTLILNGGYDKASATAALAQDQADAIAFGVPFLANPDLVARMRQDAPLNTPDFNSFYSGGATGYTDYPALD
jgi:N-ethylmaleimide reductase